MSFKIAWQIIFAYENKRSIGAEESNGVLYLMNNFLTIGYTLIANMLSGT